VIVILCKEVGILFHIHSQKIKVKRGGFAVMPYKNNFWLRNLTVNSS